MTAAQFNSLTLEERTKLVWTRGNFLAMRQRHGCSVVLYHLQECFERYGTTTWKTTLFLLFMHLKSRLAWSLTWSR